MLEEKSINYYEDTQKRSFLQMCHKVKNTLLLLMAYACPNNRIRIQLHRWRGVKIGHHVYIGLFVFLDNLYPEYIRIDDNASVNAGSMLLTHFNPMKRYAPILKARVAPIHIGEGAIVTVKSIILPGVAIGSNSIVSAGSVVDKSVPPTSLVRGNPAKVILEYDGLINDNE